MSIGFSYLRPDQLYLAKLTKYGTAIVPTLALENDATENYTAPADFWRADLKTSSADLKSYGLNI